MERLLEVDGRRRIVLGALGRRGDTRYLAVDAPDGSIVLTPAVVMTERQVRFLSGGPRAAALGRAMTAADDRVELTGELADIVEGDRSDPES